MNEISNKAPVGGSGVDDAPLFDTRPRVFNIFERLGPDDRKSPEQRWAEAFRRYKAFLYMFWRDQKRTIVGVGYSETHCFAELLREDDPTGTDRAVIPIGQLSSIKFWR